MIVCQARKLYGFGRAIDAAHPTILKVEMIPAGLSNIVQLVQTGIERSCSDLMEQGLPDMCDHKGDVRTPFAAQVLTELSRKLQTACSTTNDYDAMSHVSPVKS
ncbi:hypothetical protein D3C81_1823260 [compost metagenome]